MKITRKELIDKYIKFYKSKDHKEIPNVSLIPENDPTVLFTTAGMHPLVPYLLGQPHPLGKRLVNNQRCIRTGDIEEVGDSFHHTFFEMLGKWSLGDYWKKEAIKYTFEFLTKSLKISPEKLAVTCFKGDKNAPKDTESAKIWEKLGIKKERITFLPKSENWWGPAGKTGPCGPNTEIFYWKLNNKRAPKKFNPKDENWVEIGNDVLMEYNKDSKGNYNPAKQKSVDFGEGVERTLAVLNSYDDNYLTEIWQPIIKVIEKLSNKKYKGNEKPMRIMADHVRASVFVIGDGIIPGNTEQGYVLRRLIRRAIRYGKKIDISSKNFIPEIAKPVFLIYQNDYPELKNNKKKILDELDKEESRFDQTLGKGLNKFEKMASKKNISGKEVFLLYQSFGFPLEMTQELALEKKIKIDIKGFKKELKKHQELSRTAAKGKFSAGLADHSKKTTQLHTATHLLHTALRKVLGKHVQQMGSNITPERLRFDFSHDKKLTPEEIKKIENLINKQVSRKLNVSFEEMPYKKAVKTGALSFFKERYPEIVKVFTVGDFSKEICTGPHVKNTGEMGKFKIIKEESSSAGVRRIKAIVS